MIKTSEKLDKLVADMEAIGEGWGDEAFEFLSSEATYSDEADICNISFVAVIELYEKWTKQNKPVFRITYGDCTQEAFFVGEEKDIAAKFQNKIDELKKQYKEEEEQEEELEKDMLQRELADAQNTVKELRKALAKKSTSKKGDQDNDKDR